MAVMIIPNFYGDYVGGTTKITLLVFKSCLLRTWLDEQRKMRFARAKRGQVIIYDTEKLSYFDRIEFPVRYMQNAGLETSLWWKRRARELRIARRTMPRLSSATARRSALRISRRASAARRSRLEKSRMRVIFKISF